MDGDQLDSEPLQPLTTEFVVSDLRPGPLAAEDPQISPYHFEMLAELYENSSTFRQHFPSFDEFLLEAKAHGNLFVPVSGVRVPEGAFPDFATMKTTNQHVTTGILVGSAMQISTGGMRLRYYEVFDMHFRDDEISRVNEGVMLGFLIRLQQLLKEGKLVHVKENTCYAIRATVDTQTDQPKVYKRAKFVETHTDFDSVSFTWPPVNAAPEEDGDEVAI